MRMQKLFRKELAAENDYLRTEKRRRRRKVPMKEELATVLTEFRTEWERLMEAHFRRYPLLRSLLPAPSTSCSLKSALSGGSEHRHERLSPPVEKQPVSYAGFLVAASVTRTARAVLPGKVHGTGVNGRSSAMRRLPLHRLPVYSGDVRDVPDVIEKIPWHLKLWPEQAESACVSGRSLSAKAGLSRAPQKALLPEGGERIIEPYFDDPFPVCHDVAPRGWDYDTEPVMAHANDPDFAA